MTSTRGTTATLYSALVLVTALSGGAEAGGNEHRGGGRALSDTEQRSRGRARGIVAELADSAKAEASSVAARLRGGWDRGKGGRGKGADFPEPPVFDWGKGAEPPAFDWPPPDNSGANSNGVWWASEDRDHNNPGNGDNEDEEGCEDEFGFCLESFCDIESLRSSCAKTCDACSEAPTNEVIEANCEDEYSYCFESLCGIVSLAGRCKKTCGKCGEPTERGYVPKRRSKIAIIGAGASGLFAARELKALGYEDVTVFEAAEQVAALTVSVEYDGGVADLSTNFLPTHSFDGQQPELLRLFDQYGVPYAPVPKFQYILGGSQQAILPGPHIFAGLNASQIASDLLIGFELLQEVAAMNTVVECEERFGRGVTFAQFAADVNIPAFTRLSAFMVDAMLSGSALDLPVCYTLMLRADWMAGTIASVLYEGGLRSNLPLDPVLQQLLDDPQVQAGQTRNYCPVGFKRFFVELAAQEGIDIRLNSPITKIEKPQNPNSRVKVWVGDERRPERFNFVIVSARPTDAVKFLPPGSNVAQLYAQVETGPTASFLVKYQPGNGFAEKYLWGGKAFAAALYPTAAALGGGKQAIEAISNGAPFAIQSLESYAPKTLVAITYISDNMPMGQSEAALKEGLASVGLKVDEILDSQQFQYAEKIPLQQSQRGWNREVESLQGVGSDMKDVFFIGEALAGPGIPAQLDFVSHYIPEWFPDVNNKIRQPKMPRHPWGWAKDLDGQGVEEVTMAVDSWDDPWQWTEEENQEFWETLPSWIRQDRISPGGGESASRSTERGATSGADSSSTSGSGGWWQDLDFARANAGDGGSTLEDFLGRLQERSSSSSRQR